MAHEICFIKHEAALLAVSHPPLDREAEIRIISVFRAVARMLRAALPAAGVRIGIQHGVAPLMLRGVMRAASPEVSTRITALPRHHAAAATVSDARGIVLLSHGGQLALLMPNLRVDAALAPRFLAGASFHRNPAGATLQEGGMAILAFHEMSLALDVSGAAASIVIAELAIGARVPAEAFHCHRRPEGELLDAVAC